MLGERRCEGLISVEEKTDTVSVSGFIGKPAFGLRSRQGQYVFLNGRFIVNRTINHAVYSAYEHLLDKGTFPFFLLFLEVDPRRVDVNVHPVQARGEIRRRAVGLPDRLLAHPARARRTPTRFRP